MSCEEIENLISEYQENQLAAGQRTEVERHLAACAACRTLAQQLGQLDALLAAAIQPPALSASFDRKLQERIQTASLTDAQRAESKRQLQAEFEAGKARLRRGIFTFGTLLERLTWPALGVAAAVLAWFLTPYFTNQLTAKMLGGLDPALLPWLAATMVFGLITVSEAFAYR